MNFLPIRIQIGDMVFYGPNDGSGEIVSFNRHVAWVRDVGGRGNLVLITRQEINEVTQSPTAQCIENILRTQHVNSTAIDCPVCERGNMIFKEDGTICCDRCSYEFSD